MVTFVGSHVVCAFLRSECLEVLFRLRNAFVTFFEQNLLHRQRKSVQDRKERYDNGLLKLADTEEQVAQMQIDLEELQPKLKEATIATDALLVQIAKDTEVANEKKAVVEKEASHQQSRSAILVALWMLEYLHPRSRPFTVVTRAHDLTCATRNHAALRVTMLRLQEVICNAQAEESKALKASCEADLAEALPALESAVSALKSLSKGDIVEVRAANLLFLVFSSKREVLCIVRDLVPFTNSRTFGWCR